MCYTQNCSIVKTGDSMSAPLWLIDAFTQTRFSGNPAGVCLVPEFPEKDLMQKLANEFHWSETAFLEPIQKNDGISDKSSESALIPEFNIRWFSPEDEAPICGHATLAAAHFLWDSGTVSENEVLFHCSVGSVLVSRDSVNSFITFDFPAILMAQRPTDSEIQKVQESFYGKRVHFLEAWHDSTVFIGGLHSQKEVQECLPNLDLMKQLPYRAVIVTAQAEKSQNKDQADFVLRYFAPKVGISEDPVCGSAHCRLVPLWSQKLKKHRLISHQVSQRGGWLLCQYRDHKVQISGQACTVLKGEISL